MNVAHTNVELHVRCGMSTDVAHTDMNKSTQPTSIVRFLKGEETTNSHGSQPTTL
jgi:hypothetical protein